LEYRQADKGIVTAVPQLVRLSEHKIVLCGPVFCIRSEPPPEFVITYELTCQDQLVHALDLTELPQFIAAEGKMRFWAVSVRSFALV
jgi:hypothetical protein